MYSGPDVVPVCPGSRSDQELKAERQEPDQGQGQGRQPILGPSRSLGEMARVSVVGLVPAGGCRFGLWGGPPSPPPRRAGFSVSLPCPPGKPPPPPPPGGVRRVFWWGCAR